MAADPFKRRRFLAQLLAFGGGLLAGCDRLSQSQGFTNVLQGAERLNKGLQRLLTSSTALATEFTETDLSPVFPSNGTSQPEDAEYQRLQANGFRDWRLAVGGRVQRPATFSLEELRGLPARTQITRHDCVEGWSAIGKWQGVPLHEILARVQPLPGARYAVFYCYDPMDASGKQYYESVDMEDARHPQTLLAYALNDAPLPVPNGAPLRLRVERQLGYKMAKYLRRIELVEHFRDIGKGRGGYWEDEGYEWYAGI